MRECVSRALTISVLLSGQSVDNALMSLAVTPTGVLMFNDDEWQRSAMSGNYARAWIRALSPSGIVTGVASTPDVSDSTGVTPAATGLALGNGPNRARGIAAAPNGDVLVMTNYTIHRISPARLPDTTSCSDATVRYLVPLGDSGLCFDGNGRHKKTIDLHTAQALYTFGYDASGVLASIKDPGGRTTTVAKPGANFVISPPPPGDVNQKTTVTTSGGHATNISDNIGSFQPTSADNGLLSQLVDGENNLFSFTYDKDGYLASDTSPLGKQTLDRVPLAAGGKTVTLTSPLGLKTIFETTLDATNVLTHKTTFPDLTTEVKTKTPAGVVQTTARDGTKTSATTTVVTQLNGQIPLQATQTVKLPSGLMMTTKRSLSDPAGGPRVAKIMFDDSATPPTQTTTTTYSSTGQTIVTTSPEGRTATVKTDGTGHVKQRQIGTLTPTDSNYLNGRPLTTTQGLRTTTYTYVTAQSAVDAGYLYQIQDPIGYTREIRRDMRGRPLTDEAALATNDAAKTSFTWFKHDLVRAIRTAALNQDHTFAYNAAKEILQYLPPALATIAAPATNYTYSSDREPLTEQPPGLGSITRTYIAGTGQLDAITLPPSGSIPQSVIDYDYFVTNDMATGAAAGRISKITGPTPGNTLAYKYDGSLRTSQTWAGSVIGQVKWSYNNRFWPTQETVIAPEGSFDRFLAYDKDGLLLTNAPTNPAGADVLTLARSPIHGGVTSIIQTAAAASSVETWSYSDTAADLPNTAFGELRGQSASVAGTEVANIVYDAPGTSGSERRDNLGRIRFKTETFRNATGAHANVTKKWEYRYDGRGQLTGVYLDNASNYIATYDKNGNIKQYSTTPGSPNVTCTVDAQDRLTTCGSTTYYYYDSGELKTKVTATGTWTYSYDALGRLRKVVNGGTTYEYILDGEGRRIAKKVNGIVSKRWLYGAGLGPIVELSSSGMVRYIYGSRKNTPDVVIKGGKTYRLISDQLGSPRYAVNVADKDEVPYQISYGPLGMPTVEGGLATTAIRWIPFGFAGGLYDSDTGLVHFGAREYDPEIGRWISKDPSRFGGRQANLYVYVGNDPVNHIDLTGRIESLASCGFISTAVGGLACYGACAAVGITTGPPGIACSLACGTVAWHFSDLICSGPPPGYGETPFPTDECQGPLPSDSPDCGNENMCSGPPDPVPEPNYSAP